jgi:hypothetical protein
MDLSLAAKPTDFSRSGTPSCTHRTETVRKKTATDPSGHLSREARRTHPSGWGGERASGRPPPGRACLGQAQESGASGWMRDELFSSSQQPRGIGSRNAVRLSESSAAERAPGMILATAGCASGNCSAAARGNAKISAHHLQAPHALEHRRRCRRVLVVRSLVSVLYRRSAQKGCRLSVVRGQTETDKSQRISTRVPTALTDFGEHRGVLCARRRRSLR